MLKNVDDIAAGRVSRRQALKRGAVVGGALVWGAPTLQAVTMTVADAASGTTTPPPPSAATCIPSHGLLLFRTSTGVLVGVKVDENGSIDGIPDNGGNKDAEFLREAPRNYSGWVTPSDAG